MPRANAPAAKPTKTPARPAPPKVLVSADGQRFEVVQVIGKALGMRAGRVGKLGKTTSRAFTTVKAAQAAARARVAELLDQGYTPGSAAPRPVMPHDL